jgi:hypothetical protein
LLRAALQESRFLADGLEQGCMAIEVVSPVAGASPLALGPQCPPKSSKDHGCAAGVIADFLRP